MEAHYNKIRAIFAVEILNEGWDVLNLFDIVKLDEAPQKKNATTTKEAQLIGRGARYYPFSVADDEKYRRKYDNDLGNELRLLEEMMFHSINESRYIDAIKSELTKSGIADFDEAEETSVTMKLKESFQSHPYYKSGGIWVNRRIKKDKSRIHSIRDYSPTFGNVNPTIKLLNNTVMAYGFEEENTANEQNLYFSTLKLSDTSPYIIRSAINKVDFFHFCSLKRYFPLLRSINEFIESEAYLGSVEWTVYSDIENPSISEYEQRAAIIRLLESIKKDIIKNDSDFEGSKEFCPIPLKERLKDKTLKVKPHPNAEGMRRHRSALRLEQKEWYVYDENYGTSEEMDFVAFFDTQAALLSQKYEDIRLIRNEKAYHLYSFDHNGARFEPDFILLLTCKESRCIYQVFIEPKGDHLKLGDAWKEEFLTSLEKATLCTDTGALPFEGECFKIMGLPFYNQSCENDFKEKFSELILT
jgi:type III restriction enzyme